MKTRYSLLLTFAWFVMAFLLFSASESRSGSTENQSTDFARAKKLLLEMQQAIRTNDRSGMGELLGYPQTYTIGCEDIQINNTNDFLLRYDEIIRDDVRKAILEQNPDSLTEIGWRGFIVSGGEVWLIPTCDYVDENGKCIGLKITAKVLPALFAEPDCQQAEIDSANEVWAQFSSDDALQEKLYYGVWHVIRDIPAEIGCMAPATIKELQKSPMTLIAGKVFLDSVQFTGVSFQLRTVSVASLIDERDMEDFMWRKRRGLLADSLILMTIDYAAKPKILNPAKHRCFDRESSVHGFWIVGANTLLWYVVGEVIVLRK